MKSALFALMPSIWYSMNTGRFPGKCRGPSYEKPHNVNKLRLEDIEIIGAVGDSDTAAFAAGRTNSHTYFTEYLGSSFTTGTDGDWRTDSTLANLLKVCNPHLIGGSKGKDSAILPDEDGRGLNVAVSGAVSEDASGQAKELGRKIRYDTKPSKYLGCTTQVRGLKIVDSFNIFCPGKSLVGPTSGN